MPFRAWAFSGSPGMRDWASPLTSGGTFCHFILQIPMSEISLYVSMWTSPWTKFIIVLEGTRENPKSSDLLYEFVGVETSP